MSSIPVFVLGIKRNAERSLATAKHLKSIGFKNVSIYNGDDLKNNIKYKDSNGDEKIIKPSQIVMWNALQMLRKHRNLKELIYAEDDVRITRPLELFHHLKGGIKGIDRLVYLDWLKVKEKDRKRYKSPNAKHGTQMIGYDSNAINKLADFDKYLNYDVALNLYFNQKFGKSYGFEYVYDKGENIHKHHRKKDKERSIEFDKNNTPISSKRYSKN
jgi:hypothetical protein